MSSAVGPEYYVSILSFVDKAALEPGCSVLLHNKVMAVVGILADETDPMVRCSLLAAFACLLCVPAVWLLVAVCCAALLLLVGCCFVAGGPSRVSRVVRRIVKIIDLSSRNFRHPCSPPPLCKTPRAPPPHPHPHTHNKINPPTKHAQQTLTTNANPQQTNPKRCR